MRLPIIRHSNLGPILHRFGDTAGFVCSWPHATRLQPPP